MTTDMKKPAPRQGQASQNTTRTVKANTQQALVLELLQQRPMSAFELQRALPIADARAVVHALIAKGYPIHPHKHSDRDRSGRPIRRYHLESD